jgi:hypothetical protein
MFWDIVLFLATVLGFVLYWYTSKLMDELSVAVSWESVLRLSRSGKIDVEWIEKVTHVG